MEFSRSLHNSIRVRILLLAVGPVRPLILHRVRERLSFFKSLPLLHTLDPSTLLRDGISFDNFRDSPFAS